MWDRFKVKLLLWAAALISGAGALAVLFFYLLPAERRKGAEAVTTATKAKADALRAAAGVVERHVEQQVVKVDAEAAHDKAQDPVDFANDFIAEKKS